MGDLPTYLPHTALGRAIDAYDEARIKLNKSWHGSNPSPMSDANKSTIAPMIMEAIAAFDRCVNGETELRGGVL